MGKIKKGIKCSITLCDNDAIRSVSFEKVEASGLKVEGTKKVYLCYEHYREFKKKSKGTRQIERWRWSA